MTAAQDRLMVTADYRRAVSVAAKRLLMVVSMYGRLVGRPAGWTGLLATVASWRMKRIIAKCVDFRRRIMKDMMFIDRLSTCWRFRRWMQRRDRMQWFRRISGSPLLSTRRLIVLTCIEPPPAVPACNATASFFSKNFSTPHRHDATLPQSPR